MTVHLPEPPVPTEAQPRYHLSTGGAGYLFWAPDQNAWLLEHCVDGYWGACRVGGPEHETWRADLRAMRHLARAARTNHRTRLAARLAGATHAPWGEPLEGRA